MKAVLIGVALDWALSFAVGLVIGIGLVVYLVVGLHQSPADHAALDSTMKSNIVCLTSCIIGSLASIISGFVAGWIARSNRVKNALAVGLLSAASSVVMLPLMQGYPGWYFYACGFLTVAACALGGVIAHGIFGERAPTGNLPA